MLLKPTIRTFFITPDCRLFHREALKPPFCRIKKTKNRCVHRQGQASEGSFDAGFFLTLLNSLFFVNPSGNVGCFIALSPFLPSCYTTSYKALPDAICIFISCPDSKGVSR